MTPERPAISVILGTDLYETVRPVVKCLRRQTVKDRLELVIIAPRRESFGMSDAEGEGLAAVRFVAVGDVSRLAVARAAGVHAATAPIVVIGETHTYPDPRWAEALIRAHQGQPWAVIVPGFGNANPNGPLSWAIFLLDYGRWLAGLPAGEIGLTPTHNSSYKREVLLSMGPALETALAHGDEMTLRLKSGGHRTYFAPSAVIDHLNVTQLAPWLHERFLGGRLIAGRRAMRWAWWMRLLYIVGSPLIPAVVLSRIWRGVRQARRQTRLPFGTLSALISAAMVSGMGELVGYTWGMGTGAEAQMTEYEMHKVWYV
jgi:hypothetical protein